MRPSRRDTGAGVPTASGPEMGDPDMHRRRAHAIVVGSLALVASTLLAVDAPTSASGSAASRGGRGPGDPAGRVPRHRRDRRPVRAGVGRVRAATARRSSRSRPAVLKSYDYDAASGQFEPAATSTDFADLSVEVNNYGDRGMTGIAVDPQFPARPYVYVNYTYNRDPRARGRFPTWGTARPGLRRLRARRGQPQPSPPSAAARCSTGSPG